MNEVILLVVLAALVFGYFVGLVHGLGMAYRYWVVEKRWQHPFIKPDLPMEEGK